MATRIDIRDATSIAVRLYGLDRRAERLLRLLLEILVFEIGSSEKISRSDLREFVSNPQVSRLLANQLQADSRRLSFSRGPLSARPDTLAILHLVTQPRTLSALLSYGPPSISLLHGFLLDKE